MKLKFVGDIEPGGDLPLLIQYTFRVIQRELGLGNHREVIELEFDIPPGEDAKAAIDTLPRYPMHMHMQPYLSPPDIVAAVAHEMVHVKDLVNRSLSVSTAEEALYFNGKRIENKYSKDDTIAALPEHEKEPHERMYDLAIRAMLTYSENRGGNEFMGQAQSRGHWPKGIGFHGHKGGNDE